MSDEQTTLPFDFVAVTAVLPAGAEDEVLGYSGSARFVGFFWDGETKAVLWEDGNGPTPQGGQSFTFMRFIRPLAFLYGVNLGTRGTTATHMFVWDRQSATAYLAPRQSAERFLKQTAAELANGPIVPAISALAQIRGC